MKYWFVFGFITSVLILYDCSKAETRIIPELSKFEVVEPPLDFHLSTVCPSGLKLEKGFCAIDYRYVPSLEKNGGLGQTLPLVKLDPKVIDLGRYLFFDPILSGDKQLSCAHCHHPAYSLSDGQKQSIGRGGIGYGPMRKNGVILKRSAPSLWNVVYMKNLFWEGRASHLEDQAEGPLYSPDEMGSSPEIIESRLNENSDYKKMFRQAYGEKGSKISASLVIDALSTFERSLVSFSSRFDKWSTGDKEALNTEELLGYNVFRSFVARCAECHPPPMFTNNVFATIGVLDSKERDFGRETITGQDLLRGAFRVPSLRNIAKTAPYMHAGNLNTLEEVIRFYNEGGGRGNGAPSDLRIHWHVRKMGLSKKEISSIISFLNTLTDETSMPKFPKSVPSGLPVALEFESFQNRSSIK
ncbi:Cytochrome c peroxidase [Leptospira biflexa serovar Patoc strain 'Patoc 1 (Ames)']|uniref:Putative di-haem cytochrome c peroxidase n=1 Tax=Leptospira biflexa serovar Patoc (strain Patoc 1 / ATCC 23582 / Paris) TaxID=456481 RepID=B0SNP1_LEPBP|nr:cytochrome c peroxidase [Leptospira biflexa]ABZ93687.1 Cytochrome c peroxidase [Leptospira biflexa serovar Patoc strain 'Patoc 1 (Ames)']ABZ97322.1 Putative di-haem cytochrome c peroxidase [Leptospira biflexa serovar Patoc strain 'Patoc 1 (Paris)']